MSTILATAEGRIYHGHHHYSPVVHFGRREFLGIVYAEKPGIIYRKERTHFFFLVGLKVCTTECDDGDFTSSHVVLPLD